MPKCKYRNKFFRTNKLLEMHIFQVHERRGTKTDKVKFDWTKPNSIIFLHWFRFQTIFFFFIYFISQAINGIFLTN